jgi:uncharacterized protein (TIGR00255 family)
MKSMTGYGTAKFNDGEIDLQIEIKSVNSRYLDLRVYLPREINYYEAELRKTIASRLRRGAIDVRININDSRIPRIKINEQKLKLYYDLFSKAIAELNLNDTVSAEYLLNEPGVIENQIDNETDTQLKAALDNTLDKAINNLVSSTLLEGEDMRKTLSESMSTILEAVNELEDTIEPYRKQLFTNMHSRIMDLLSNLKVDTMEQRLVQELAIYIDKYDVQEEITRLKSHIETFNATLKNKSNEDIGKTLNFIIQEMQREANTLGSKYSTTKSFKYILVIKEEIEKDREIVQNVA